LNHPAGAGIRIDSFGYAGYATSPRYDSLLAKLVTYTPGNDFTVAARKAYRACSEFRIEGIATNLPFILNLLSGTDFESNTIYTRYVDDHLLELAKARESYRKIYSTRENSGSGTSAKGTH
jgi:pyruvate carboxylase